MLNILYYVGMSLQSEVCLWTLLGLLRSIFDATLFKVNANLKQVWQMTMPAGLSMPMQRVLRTMISGVMLVQCFTVYVYLAAYIVLLYPIFLEERPTLVLPWLLLAAIRKFLCELTSLALGLATCVLLGPSRPSCVKFLVFKVASILPAFYIWMLVLSYYNMLKVTTSGAYKTFPAVTSSDHDYGLELAVRRRRTKSLLDEEQLRKKIIATINLDTQASAIQSSHLERKKDISSRMINSTDTSAENLPNFEIVQRQSNSSQPVDMGISSEVWYGHELVVPRDADRILEQFVLMMLRIADYKTSESSDLEKLFSSHSRMLPYIDCQTIAHDELETPIQVGSKRGKTASYIQEYPQIFNKKQCENQQTTPELTIRSVYGNSSYNESETPINQRNVASVDNIVTHAKKVAITEEQTEKHKPTNKVLNFKHLDKITITGASLNIDPSLSSNPSLNINPSLIYNPSLCSNKNFIEKESQGLKKSESIIVRKELAKSQEILILLNKKNNKRVDTDHATCSHQINELAGNSKIASENKDYLNSAVRKKMKSEPSKPQPPKINRKKRKQD